MEIHQTLSFPTPTQKKESGLGTRLMALSERLQMYPDLTLAKTMKMVRQKEAVHQHNTQLQGGLDCHAKIGPDKIGPLDAKTGPAGPN